MTAQADRIAAPLRRAGASPRLLPMQPLVLGMAALISLTLCLIVSIVLIDNARKAVAEETRSAFQLARESVERRMPPSHGGRDTLAEAVSLAEEVDGLRHVSARLLDPDGQPLHLRAHGRLRKGDGVPGWFSALMTSEPFEVAVPVTHYPTVLGFLHVATDPADEIAEVWDDFSVILPVLFLTGLAIIALGWLVTRLVAQRLQLVETAMAQMQQGQLSVRAPGDRLAEFDRLAAGVNALASHLQAERAENELLQARLIGSSEAERSRIALDLHDEMGPQLFALRAAVTLAQSLAAEMPAPQRAQLNDTLDAIADHAAEVQKSARTAINDLRPMLLGQATLTELLAELVAGFRDMSPQTRVMLDIDPEVEGASPGELAELSIYRFVRESVLNALRHGAPGQVRVTVEPEADQIVVRVTDNGHGPRSPQGHDRPAIGFGQIGMQDRARALGARYLPPWREDRLTHTELRMPRP